MAYDAASSRAIARVVAACNTVQAAAFLKHVVAAALANVFSWRLQRGLIDGGSAFRGEVEGVYRGLDVRHTRTQPRHAWMSGFVERLQGTILHEHWWVFVC